MVTPKDFEDYAKRFPDATQTVLRKMRATIQKAAPSAEETIGYNLPAFSVNGNAVVWYAAFKRHIGFYPGAAAVRAFAKDLVTYETAKGSIRFPLDRPLPSALIGRIVKHRLRTLR
ncbi:MAG TPA: DUF1801 domain-containing protein [Candidatus Acidoferrales bacterium]|nr:DUF1801 domain-containing protein [Candidatus Acidoferrales bacterium]